MYLALFSLIYQFEFPLASGGYNHSCISALNCNFNILTAGIDILPLALGMTAIALVTSVVVSRVGVKPLAISGGLVIALGFLLEAYATNLTTALAIEVVIGAGMGLLNASIINLLVLTVDPKDMGQATAMNNVFRNVGGSLGAPLAGSLLATYILTSGLATGFPLHLAFQYAFWIAAAITVVGTITVFFAQEVLGPRRHEKFAHLPTLPRRGGRGAGATSPPGPAVPTPIESLPSGAPDWNPGRAPCPIPDPRT
jgi:MFS family permease